MCHEGNSEQLFSISGALSDDNGKMDPVRLATWTSVAANRGIYMPPHELILKRYLLKFGKGGKLPACEAESFGFVDAVDDPAFDAAPASASAPASDGPPVHHV